MAAAAAKFDDTPLYFEPQVAALCGRHAVNNLLQGPFFSEVDLADLASELDERERALMLEAGTDTADALRYLAEESFNVDNSGNFSISVLREAVNRSHGISFDSEPAVVDRALRDPGQFEGFLLNLDSHWFVVRKIVTAAGPRWFNLNSLLKSPAALGEFFIAAFLAQLRSDGYSIFVVLPGPLGRLPDPVDTSQGDARCWLRVGDVLARVASADGARAAGAARAQQSAAEDPEFEAALRASLASGPGGGGGGGSGGGPLKRPRSGAQPAAEGGGDDDEDLERALHLSLLTGASRGSSAPAISPGGSSCRSDAAELEAALALSLGGGGGGEGAPGPTPGVRIADVVAEILRLRAASAAALDAPAAGGPPAAARLQVRLPAAPPFRLEAECSAAAPAPPQPPPVQRRFEGSAPVSRVFDWAALNWLEAAFPEAAAAAAGGAGGSADAGVPIVPAFVLSAAPGSSAAPRISLRSDCAADRCRSVADAGLLPSISLSLHPC